MLCTAGDTPEIDEWPVYKREAEAALQVIESAAPACETCDGLMGERIFHRKEDDEWRKCPACGGSGRSSMLLVDLMRGMRQSGWRRGTFVKVGTPPEGDGWLPTFVFLRVASSEHPS